MKVGYKTGTSNCNRPLPYFGGSRMVKLYPKNDKVYQPSLFYAIFCYSKLGFYQILYNMRLLNYRKKEKTINSKNLERKLHNKKMREKRAV